MIRRPPRSTLDRSSAASDVYKRQPEIPLIIVDGEIIFCEGDSVTLISTALFGNNWNNGDTTNSIVVYEEGIYTVEITNQCGTSISAPVSIIVYTNPLAIVSNDGELEFCYGEDVVLTASEGENYLWNNGENTESIVVTESDTLFVTITDLNGCMTTSDSVAVIAHPLPEIPIITNSNDTLYTIEGYTYQWLFEGVIIPGATNYYLVAACLLYTSDAADERSSVDLGGRRIIKKKNRYDQCLE